MLTLSDIYHIIDQQLFDNGKKESLDNVKIRMRWPSLSRKGK